MAAFVYFSLIKNTVKTHYIFIKAVFNIANKKKLP